MRVDEMFASGLIEEVERVIVPVRESCTTALQSIGYKEVLMYLDGDLSLEETKELIKKRTRNYAKRQLTWFRRNNEINSLSGEDLAAEAIFIIEKYKNGREVRS